MDRLTIRRPTHADIAVITAQSHLTESVKLHKPTFDYILGSLGSEAEVSRYVSHRITSELVRLSKMKSPNLVPRHIGQATDAMIEQRRTASASRWSGNVKQKRAKLCVDDAAHQAYIASCDDRLSRPDVIGALVEDALDKMDAVKAAAYCATPPPAIRRVVTIPHKTAEAVRKASMRLGLPYIRVMSYLLLTI